MCSFFNFKNLASSNHRYFTVAEATKDYPVGYPIEQVLLVLSYYSKNFCSASPTDSAIKMLPIQKFFIHADKTPTNIILTVFKISGRRLCDWLRTCWRMHQQRHCQQTGSNLRRPPLPGSSPLPVAMLMPGRFLPYTNVSHLRLRATRTDTERGAQSTHRMKLKRIRVP